MGPDFLHWRHAKIGRRFLVFFRYNSRTRVIVSAWVNDENTLRVAGGKSDPYAVFQKMLGRGNPPDDWDALLRQSSRQSIKPYNWWSLYVRLANLQARREAITSRP